MPDLFGRQDIHVVDVGDAGGHGGDPRPAVGLRLAGLAARRRDDRGARPRLEGRAGSRNDIWLFAADGSDATPTGGRNLSARHDLMPGSAMNSDVTRGEAARGSMPSPDGRWIVFSAPIDGAYELWRIAVADGASSG